eukprot:1640984-Prymnesium_polylepis.1
MPRGSASQISSARRPKPHRPGDTNLIGFFGFLGRIGPRAKEGVTRISEAKLNQSTAGIRWCYCALPDALPVAVPCHAYV